MVVSTLPPKLRPTNGDIAMLIGELHNCLHSVNGKIDGVVKEVAETNQRVARVEGFQSGIATRLRVPADGETISFWQRWKNPITLAGAVLGSLTAFVGLYPLIRVVFLAADAYLTAHK